MDKHLKTILSLVAIPMLASLLSGCADTIAAGYGVHDKLACLAGADEKPLPPRQRGEFPFRFVYDIDGQRKTIEDTQICEFKGRTCTMYGRRDDWQSTLASGQSQWLIQEAESGREHLEYVAPIGDCRDLMAKPGYRNVETPSWGGLTMQVYEHGHFQYTGRGAAAKGVKVISFEQWAENPSMNP